MNTRYSPRNFLKGKIGEFVFEEMFRRTDKFTILPFGFERTLPEIAQHVKDVTYKPVLEDIRNSPDFILIKKDRTEIYIVEVKYRTSPDWQELTEKASFMKDRWTAPHIFLATPDGFYFDSCSKIIRSNGKMDILSEEWVDLDTQREFLELLKEFMPNKAE